MQHDKIAVIDFGGQYAHLIATKVRRLNVFAEIRQPEDPKDAFLGFNGIIMSGGPALLSQGDDSDYNAEILDLDIPILGLCFGHQEIAHHYGGTVSHGGREWGYADLHITKPHPLFNGLGPVEQVWMSHFDSVSAVGPDFEELGYTVMGESAPHRFAVIGSDRLRRYGFQFHAEVDDTPNGDRMLENFVFGICGCEPSWTMERYLEEQIHCIRQKVDGKSVFLLASGGVDSTVAAELFGKALGPERLHLLHVDNGLMRKDESKNVIEMFKELGLGENLHFVDATDTFLKALKGVFAPEEKRRIIGTTFVEVFDCEAKRLGIEDHLLGQGTIYPDTIETGATKRSAVIKTHHNRVELIEKLISEGKVVEPLADLYKVEVRELGEMLGIPKDSIWRHPFPGPGLGVRLLCSDGKVDPAEAEILTKQADDAAGKFGASALVLPIRSVGVKADIRSYEHPVMIHGDSDRKSPFDRNAQLELSDRMLREISGINRCVLNLSDDRPKTARALEGYVTRDRLDLLREADAEVMAGLKRHGLYDRIWQCPTVLIPLEINGKGRELVIIRPIHSERAMTASAAALPETLIAELKQSILALPGISGLALDLTSKPPGTIEWE
jgi:GMP synthase (glutamine-hydrolysing)